MEAQASERSFLRTPVVLLFGSQLLAGICLALILVPVFVNVTGAPPAIPLVLTLQGLISTVIGMVLGLSKWWSGVQFALPFAAFYSIGLQVPAWLWLVLFVLVFLVYKNSVRSGVPLYLSNPTTWSALVNFIPETKGVKVLDLGGGLGGTALYMGAKRPEAGIISIESAPIPAAISKLRLKFSGRKNVEMRFGDFWEADLSDAQVCYAFLSPVPMEKLFKKVKAEMLPGSTFISNSFDVPGVQADEIIELSDKRKTKLHVWRL